MSWNFVRLHEIQFQTGTESFSFLSWKAKNVLFLKKYFFTLKMTLAVLIFSEGFGLFIYNSILHTLILISADFQATANLSWR